MGNGKWGNGKKHFTQQKAANVLWLHSSGSFLDNHWEDHPAWQLALAKGVCNHYTTNNFGRPCTQFRLMYPTPLYISQEFNHEFNHLRYTLHLPWTMQRRCITVCKLVLCSLLAFLKFVESVSYFVSTLYTRSHLEASSCSCLHCYGYRLHIQTI